MLQKLNRKLRPTEIFPWKLILRAMENYPEAHFPILEKRLRNSAKISRKLSYPRTIYEYQTAKTSHRTSKESRMTKHRTLQQICGTQYFETTKLYRKTFCAIMKTNALCKLIAKKIVRSREASPASGEKRAPSVRAFLKVSSQHSHLEVCSILVWYHLWYHY